ncbi:glucose-1-phosphate adenylyltransferase subunit GlgD [Desemzia sp. RIT804]|uniref:glucose-1-phosphate adenylyltransferase subunit GlgD n=1 Tax=Desemzia sp. RIT 804 TaxID=2810209 RepID=UPI001952913B|nr:glucose-1-phosphate adenylyltransferase subunit GlgD [Desemzia sp. RIT 804]MBM6614453.1 glucose-1-phosphate adenylyltransferase subunit GlgD [Desemzia sp. RIT 804]
MMKRNSFCAIVNLVEDGSRLEPLTRKRPIAALPFASRYRLIDFPFTALHNAEVTSAALFISGSGHSLYDHIRSGFEWGLDSTIGGGVFTHSQIDLKESAAREGDNLTYYEDQRNYVKKSGAEYVVITGSKMLCHVNLRSILRYHQENSADITVVYKNMVTSEVPIDSELKCYSLNSDTGVIECLNLVSEVMDQGKEKLAIQTGITMMSVEKYLHYLDLLEKRQERHQVGLMLNLALEEGNKVCGFEYTGYLKYIDTVLSYFEANMDMLDEDNYNSLFYRDEPVITRARNGAPTYYSPSSKASNVQIATDCYIDGEVENTIIFRKVRIKENAVVKNSIIMQGSQIGEGAQLEYVILDKNVTVAPGVKLIGTPEQPIVVEKGTLLTEKKGA